MIRSSSFRAAPAAGLAPAILMGVLLAIQLTAFWPTWRWYLLRISGSPEEAWGLASLAGAIWVIAREIARKRGHRSKAVFDGPGTASILLTGLLAAAHPWLTPLPRAALALAALAAWLPRLGIGSRAALHVLGFLLLSLPLVPSLQFYLGYPLRALTAGVSAFLLNLAGYPVFREGTLLTWQDRAVFVDAPCSGVKMIWAGLLLAQVLAARSGMGIRATAELFAAAIGAVIAGNILRATALFFLETGLVRGPAWAHGAIGLLAFAATAGILMAWESHTPKVALSPAGGSRPCPA